MSLLPTVLKYLQINFSITRDLFLTQDLSTLEGNLALLIVEALCCVKYQLHKKFLKD